MSDYQAYSVRVLGIETHEDRSGPYTCYILRIDSSKSGAWVVERRYQEFFDLHSKLINEFSSIKSELPKLPPKKLFGKMNKEVIEERKMELVNYLNLLLIHIKPSHSDHLNEFLNKNKKVIEEP